ncbi:unnamed protein product [Mycena citricolor]|uniref:Uncharacterized protein n=1 Tax=Mycena citricolor TaxID=2018698 RepID=A0AAD2GZ71_9AGAR|nr:unnamed protein product [Mycena citricolor]
MVNHEQDSLPSVLHGDPSSTVLVATTLATLLLAGGAYICRSGSKRLGLSSQLSSVADSHGAQHPLGVGGPGDNKQSKVARSKERRRRGKDPMKEILKNGKKLKMLTVVSREQERDENTASCHLTQLPHVPESPTASSSSKRSASTSSRSVASSTTSHNIDDDSPAIFASDDRKHDGRGERMSDSQFDTGNTPGDFSDCEPSGSSGAGVLASPAQRKTSSNSTIQPASSSSGWEWDGHGHGHGASSNSACTFNPSPASPPRLGSQSEEGPMRASVSLPTVAGSATVLPPPLFHSSSAPLVEPLSAFEASRTLGSPRHTSSPRRSPTPAGTPPPSLNVQTQLASMRGALEAARLREEKARSELERYSKDMEIMRWENNAWRRREAEMQAQISHMMHQLQGYAAMFAAPGQAPHTSSTPASPPLPAASGYPMPFPPAMYPFYPYPHPHQHQPQPGSLPNAQQQQMFSMSFPRPASSVSGSSGGSSGSGSGSPDLVGSPASFSRGRRRTRTQTADARLGGGEEGGVDGDHLETDEMVLGEMDDDGHEEEDSGFSEMLADAILKRPESIRMPLKKRKSKEIPTEFTFPSISDLGYREPPREKVREDAPRQER